MLVAICKGVTYSNDPKKFVIIGEDIVDIAFKANLQITEEKKIRFIKSIKIIGNL